GIKVAFMAGNYGPLELTLTEEDSGTPECPITYCKYGDGDVVFNNGFDCEVSDFVDISDEERSLFAEKFADGIKKADVSSVFDATENPDAIRVYYNGGMMTKARFPNKYLDGSDNLPPTAETVDETHLLIFFSLMYKRLEKYSERCFETMEIWGHIVRGYRKDTFKIVGYDSETRLMEVGQSSTDEFGGHLRVDEGLWMGADGKGVDMCFSNVPYELDFEGEYWIDPTTKTLYVYKPEGTYFIPGPGTMVTMDHADDVTFRGLCFRASEERFIYAHMCHGVTLELCEFNGTAATEGVYFDDNSAQRPMDLTVRECTFSNTYGHALFVNGHNIGEHKFEKSTGVVFDNNLVQTTNIAYDVWNGIHFNHCTDVAVTHNRFEECRRGAVSFNQSSGLLVEYNDFDSAMCDSNDGGVIYTDWICDGRDLVVRYNYFGKVESAGAGQYGLYLDEFSSGFDICSNLFYDTGSCAAMFSLGRDNTFRENVILYGSACDWGTSTRNEIEEAGSPEEAGRQGSWGINYGKLTWTEFFDNCKYPPYRQVIEERWPDMLNIHFEYDNIDDPYFALNQVTYVIGNAAVSKSADRSIFTTGRKYEKIYAHYENNATYTTDENPIFVNPTLGDYRIREDSGFPDIHFESIGRY
ncbi:MAG: right-handed parallel beta-helix repeat-containing protein, partial [Clostridia bacterium]|nr:right-handed parallel beta-helix repeat-containing protein [Clostridia bacterium]